MFPHKTLLDRQGGVDVPDRSLEMAGGPGILTRGGQLRQYGLQDLLGLCQLPVGNGLGLARAAGIDGRLLGGGRRRAGDGAGGCTGGRGGAVLAFL